MNSEVKAILDTITVGGEPVANSFIFFDGQADTYLLYSPSSESVGLSGDDKPLQTVEGWDIDVYSRTNYLELAKAVKTAFIAAGWVYRGSGMDTYDEPTQMYHRLLEFAHEGDNSFLEGVN